MGLVCSCFAKAPEKLEDHDDYYNPVKLVGEPRETVNEEKERLSQFMNE
jgi:hypothetical protein